VQPHCRCWRPAVVNPEDWVDQDLGTGPKQRVAGLERLSGVCQVLESVIVLPLEDSALSRQLVKKNV
jgi:hypothetical protein